MSWQDTWTKARFPTAKRIVARALVLFTALLPGIWLLTIDQDLRGDGANPWRNGWYVGVFLLLATGAFLWARHFFSGTPLIRVVCLLAAVASGWKATCTDWVVWTRYDYMGAVSLTFYKPPVSPLWHPPTPQDWNPAATSWRDTGVFAIGGAGGPSEEPYLRVHWVFVFSKILAVVAPGYLIAALVVRLSKIFRPTSGG